MTCPLCHRDDCYWAAGNWCEGKERQVREEASSDRRLELMARAACDCAAEIERPSAVLGHRFNYLQCVGPRCSCWPARVELATRMLAAARQVPLEEKST